MARPKAFDEQKILNKAMYLFWEKGYQATSIQDLEEHLNIGRRSLYNSFGSKYELFLAALHQYASYGNPDFKAESLGPCEEQSAIEVIRGVFDRLYQATLDEDYRGCLLVNSAMEFEDREDQVNDYTRQSIKSTIDEFYKLIRVGQIQKEIPIEKDPLALAQYLTNAYLGFRVMANMSSDKEAFTNSIDVIMQSLL